MKHKLACLKICAVFFLVQAHVVTLGYKLSAQCDVSRHSYKTLRFTRSNSAGPSTKWHIDRVSHKQFELINKIWRRTNIFVDVDDAGEIESTAKKHNPNMRLSNDTNNLKIYSFSKFQHSTPSYIEFFYLEEVNNSKYVNMQPRPVSKLSFEKNIVPNYVPNKKSTEKISFSRSPRLIFQLYDLSNQKSNNQCAKRNTRKNNKKDIGDLSFKILSKIIVQSYENDRIFNEKTFVENDNMDMSTARISVKMLSSVEVSSKEVTKASSKDNIITAKKYDRVASSKDIITAKIYDRVASSKDDIITTKKYDRVKFFDIYDSDTEELSPVTRDLHYITSSQKSEHTELISKENHNSSAEITKFVSLRPLRNTIYSTSHTDIRNTINSTFHTVSVKSLEDNKIQLPPKLAPPRSKAVNWTEYPYIAAYIYDRYKVHCDAAAISAHWLMAAGSCLSRHSDDPSVEGRSAFVTYCGSTWWNPERIAYVKYSIVHPMYNPGDKTRKYLYNIGLIQVVTSMASACPTWKPVILMSYHYNGGHDSVAVTVGWGLDRYGVKYSSSDIPKRPLSVYAGSVYSDLCPGNTGHQKAKDDNDEGLKNVYCLALPNYSREDLDPLHGGLLVVGGNLIALFLQEERRVRGDQAAEYTGVWRLLPWVTEEAQEPEKADFLLL